MIEVVNGLDPIVIFDLIIWKSKLAFANQERIFHPEKDHCIMVVSMKSVFNLDNIDLTFCFLLENLFVSFFNGFLTPW